MHAATAPVGERDDGSRPTTATGGGGASLTLGPTQSRAATRATEMGMCPAGQNPDVMDPGTPPRERRASPRLGRPCDPPGRPIAARMDVPGVQRLHASPRQVKGLARSASKRQLCVTQQLPSLIMGQVRASALHTTVL
jgi:hypothetical protein